MNGLQEIAANDRAEIVKVYTQSREKGDKTLQANLRWAHSDLASHFDKVDSQTTEGSKAFA